MAIFLYENNYSFTFWTVDTWRTFHCAHLRPRLVWSLYSPGNHERSLRGDLIQLLKFIKGINELSWVNPPAARCGPTQGIKGHGRISGQLSTKSIQSAEITEAATVYRFKNRYDAFKPAVKHPLLSTTP